MEQQLLFGIPFKASSEIEVLDEFEGQKGQFLKTFAINDKRNKNGWRAVWEGIKKNIHTFKDKPGIEFLKCTEDGCDLDHTEAQTEEMSLEVQEPFRVTTIVDFTLDENTHTSYFIHKVNEPEFFSKVKSGEVKYVSPSIWPKSGGYEIVGKMENGNPMIDVWDWGGLHDAYVNKPAFGDDAKITATCEGTSCPVKLLSASVLKALEKSSKAESNYHKGVDDRICRNCRFFNYEEGTCQVVAGPIDPYFTSDRFQITPITGIVDQGDISHLQEIPLLVNHNKKKRFIGVNARVHDAVQKIFDDGGGVEESKLWDLIREDKVNSSFSSCTCSGNQKMPEDKEHEEMKSKLAAAEHENEDYKAKLQAQEDEKEKNHNARKARLVATLTAQDEEEREKTASAIRATEDEEEMKALDEAEKEVKTAKKAKYGQEDEEKKEQDAKIAALESKLSEPKIDEMAKARALKGATDDQILEFKKSYEGKSLKAVEADYAKEKILIEEALSSAEQPEEQKHFSFEGSEKPLSAKSLEEQFEEVIA